MTFDFAACSTHMEGMTPEELESNLKLACEYCYELEEDRRALLNFADTQAAIIRDLQEKNAALQKRAETAERCADRLAEESV